jgi:hypothetical protein
MVRSNGHLTPNGCLHRSGKPARGYEPVAAGLPELLQQPAETFDFFSASTVRAAGHR